MVPGGVGGSPPAPTPCRHNHDTLSRSPMVDRSIVGRPRWRTGYHEDRSNGFSPSSHLSPLHSLLRAFAHAPPVCTGHVIARGRETRDEKTSVGAWKYGSPPGGGVTQDLLRHAHRREASYLAHRRHRGAQTDRTALPERPGLVLSPEISPFRPGGLLPPLNPKPWRTQI